MSPPMLCSVKLQPYKSRRLQGTLAILSPLLTHAPAPSRRLIINLWRQCSEHAAKHPESDWEGEGATASGARSAPGTGAGACAIRRNSKVTKLLRNVTKMVQRESCTSGPEALTPDEEQQRAAALEGGFGALAGGVGGKGPDGGGPGGQLDRGRATLAGEAGFRV